MSRTCWLIKFFFQSYTSALSIISKTNTWIEIHITKHVSHILTTSLHDAQQKKGEINTSLLFIYLYIIITKETIFTWVARRRVVRSLNIKVMYTIHIYKHTAAMTGLRTAPNRGFTEHLPPASAIRVTTNDKRLICLSFRRIHTKSEITNENTIAEYNQGKSIPNETKKNGKR